jgi:hypothetical protein
VSDTRNPPDYGRIAWPEDIFGSLEVDGEGKFVGEFGEYQESGTYRVCTNEGMLVLLKSSLSGAEADQGNRLGLPPYLRDRLVEELRRLEAEEKTQAR